MFKKYQISLLILIFLYSCSEYQKVLKNDDIAEKYNIAEQYYEAGMYRKSNRLLEQIISFYTGKPQAERILFFLANSYFYLKDYYLAEYYFEKFNKNYPQSQKIIETTFMEAKAKYMQSPPYNLDQIETYTALEKLENFINNYQQSEYIEQANIMFEELQKKIEKKFFNNSKLYYTIKDYKSAIYAIDNFISDFPGTSYREEALYYKFKSSYEVAINSIEIKKKERLEDTYDIYKSLKKKYPETIFEEDLQIKIETIIKEIKKYN